MKKGQMEILGLAIAVVLILVAVTFAVRFLMAESPTDYRKKFVSKELASNMVNTFLKTTAADCSNLDMTELLQNCAELRSITCENGEDTCSYAESTAKQIFSQTLDAWSRKYEFRAYANTYNSLLVNIGEPCKREKEHALFPVPISAGTVYVELNICI